MTTPEEAEAWARENLGRVLSWPSPTPAGKLARGVVVGWARHDTNHGFRVNGVVVAHEGEWDSSEDDVTLLAPMPAGCEARFISLEYFEHFGVFEGAAVPAGPDPSRFPHVCPKCGSPAYIGFNSTECSKAGCR